MLKEDERTNDKRTKYETNGELNFQRIMENTTNQAKEIETNLKRILRNKILSVTYTTGTILSKMIVLNNSYYGSTTN